MKIIFYFVCSVENYHYLCSVFNKELRPKVLKKAEKNEY